MLEDYTKAQTCFQKHYTISAHWYGPFVVLMSDSSFSNPFSECPKANLHSTVNKLCCLFLAHWHHVKAWAKELNSFNPNLPSPSSGHPKHHRAQKWKWASWSFPQGMPQRLIVAFVKGKASGQNPSAGRISPHPWLFQHSFCRLHCRNKSFLLEPGSMTFIEETLKKEIGNSKVGKRCWI